MTKLAGSRFDAVTSQAVKKSLKQVVSVALEQNHGQNKLRRVVFVDL
jgi:hypothetical protein